MRPDAPAESAQQRRRLEIVEAADRCIRIHGMQRLTLRDVARESGMSLGNLYNYFPKKEALIEALVERETNRFLETIVEAGKSSGGTPAERLRARFGGIVDAYMDPDSLIVSLFIANESLTNPRVREICVAANKRICEFVLQLIRRDSNEEISPKQLELIEAQIFMTRSHLESLRGALLYNPGIDRALLRRVSVDRLLLFAFYDRAAVDGETIETYCRESVERFNREQGAPAGGASSV